MGKAWSESVSSCFYKSRLPGKEKHKLQLRKQSWVVNAFVLGDATIELVSSVLDKLRWSLLHRAFRTGQRVCGSPARITHLFLLVYFVLHPQNQKNMNSY